MSRAGGIPVLQGGEDVKNGDQASAAGDEPRDSGEAAAPSRRRLSFSRRPVWLAAIVSQIAFIGGIFAWSYYLATDVTGALPAAGSGSPQASPSWLSAPPHQVPEPPGNVRRRARRRDGSHLIAKIGTLYSDRRGRRLAAGGTALPLGASRRRTAPGSRARPPPRPADLGDTVWHGPESGTSISGHPWSVTARRLDAWAPYGPPTANECRLKIGSTLSPLYARLWPRGCDMAETLSGLTGVVDEHLFAFDKPGVLAIPERTDAQASVRPGFGRPVRGSRPPAARFWRAERGDSTGSGPDPGGGGPGRQGERRAAKGRRGGTAGRVS